MPVTSSLPAHDLLETARQTLASRFDPAFGGFGSAPKSTQPHALERLLRHYARSERAGKTDRDALHMACHTLRRMALGGIYDQIGGGFARYSTDAQWMIPHCEKSLIDNALLIRVATDAHRATGDKFFRRIARETSEWVINDMQLDHGGFAFALAAGNAQDEGSFYLWTPDALREVLTPAEAQLAILRLGLDEKPNFHGQWYPQVHMAFSELAKRLQTPRDTVVAQWQSAKAKLLSARNTREHPERDDHMDIAAHALMIDALAHAGRFLTLPDLINAAERAETAIERYAWQEPAVNDQAFMLAALIELQQTRWSSKREQRLLQLAHVLSAPNAIDPRLPLTDHLQPSPHGVAAIALNRLGHWHHEPDFLAAAERILDAAASEVGKDPVTHCTLLSALEEVLDTPELVIIRDTPDALNQWREVTDAGYRPHRVVVALDTNTANPHVPDQETGAWVIHDGHAQPKATTPTELTDRLNSHR